MSNAYTPSIKLAMPAIGDTGWSIPVNGNCSALDALNPVGGLAVTTHEQPSSTLHVDIAPGIYMNQSGVVVSYIGAANQAVAASATNYIFLDAATSNLVINTTGWPATPHVRLATVVTGMGAVTSITDWRVPFTVIGPIADGATWQLGTSTGLQIGTAASQKLGFFGATPIAQPTLGAATAGASYGSNEQAMLNAVYSALRNLGLGN